VFPVRYELGSCIPEDDIRHSHGRKILKSYQVHAKFHKDWFRHSEATGTVTQKSVDI
jgi:hypothetical protein